MNGYRKSNESEEEFELRKSQCSSYKKNSINFEGLLDKKKVLIEKKFCCFNDIIGCYFYEL